MKLYLAGTERLKSDIKLYLAGADVIEGYRKGYLSESGGAMKCYLSESGGAMKCYLSESELYKDAYVLQSYFYADDFTEKIVIPNSKDFLLDSGAFSFISGSKAPNWNEYVDGYADFINRNHIDKYFELDIDKIIGFENVLQIRNALYQKTGIKPIPVWHKSRGIEQFKRDAYDYPYVALGGIALRDIKPKEYVTFPWFINEAHKNGAKIHALGFTNLEGLTKYHFDSVDSTAWVSGNRFGAVYKFDGKTMRKVNKPEGKRVKANVVALNNFTEWKKFSAYADSHL